MARQARKQPHTPTAEGSSSLHGSGMAGSDYGAGASHSGGTSGMANNIGLGGIRSGDGDASYNPAGPTDNVQGAIDSDAEGNMDVNFLAGAGAADSTIHATDDWNEEDRYWQESFTQRPYALPGVDYETYRAAYRYGVEVADLYEGQPFEAVEQELQSGWEAVEDSANLAWGEARVAARDAFLRRREK